MLDIAAVAGAARTPATGAAERKESASDSDFGETLGKLLDEAREAERVADEAAAKFADGDPSVGIHEVIIASEKAAVQLRFATTLKNRVVEAYRELMNTQI